jgi:Holliday junction DNA helicase RuvA
MIVSLQGEIIERGIDHVVLDVGGIGYRVSVSLHTLAELPPVGKATRLLTHLYIREDAWTIFGFSTAEERRAFEVCFSVQGVGPKLVMSILSSLNLDELAAAVSRGDVARLKKVPGVGQKTAERLVLELKDKLHASRGSASLPQAPASDAVAQVASALNNLGYKPVDADRAAREAHKAEPAGTVEALLKKALRSLSE